MPEDLTQLLTRLSEDHTLLNSVEEATKQGAVLPVLSALGWNCFNIQEVTPEFSVGTGRIDYCLRINNNRAVFIEVKRANEVLEKHEKQLLEYSFSMAEPSLIDCLLRKSWKWAQAISISCWFKSIEINFLFCQLPPTNGK